MKKLFSEDALVKNLNLYYLNRHLRKKPVERYHHEIDASALHDREKYKKKSEVLLLNAFLHHYPELKFESLTCENPDFIAKIGGKTIGIELTEVINHLEIKKTECHMNKIFRRVELALEEEDKSKYRGIYFLELMPLTVHVLTQKHDEIVHHITKSIVNKKACGAVKKIRKYKHRRNVFITHDFNLSLFDGLSSEKIIEMIHKKNQKHPFYNQNLDECWLVIVSDMNSMASRFSFIQNQEDLHQISSPFDRIFHLENLCGNLLHIK